MEVRDKARTISALKEALRAARKSETAMAKQLQEEERERTLQLRTEYESRYACVRLLCCGGGRSDLRAVAQENVDGPGLG